MSEPIQDELRRFALSLHTKNQTLEDTIILLHRAADRIDQLEMDKNFTQAEKFCAGIFNNH